jgi:hypothetical protein
MRGMDRKRRKVGTGDGVVGTSQIGRRIIATIAGKASITLEGAPMKLSPPGIQNIMVINGRGKDPALAAELIRALLRLPADSTKHQSAIEDLAPLTADGEAQRSIAKRIKVGASHEVKQDDPRRPKTSLIRLRRSWDHCRHRNTPLYAHGVEVHRKAIRRASMHASPRRTILRWTTMRSQTMGMDGAMLSKRIAIASDGSSKEQRGSRQPDSVRSR